MCSFMFLFFSMLDRAQNSTLESVLKPAAAGYLVARIVNGSRDVWSPSSRRGPPLPCLRTCRDLIRYLRVLRSAGMRDLFGINGAWTEERHDVYECCAFVDWCRDTGADTVRLHSHPVVA